MDWAWLRRRPPHEGDGGEVDPDRDPRSRPVWAPLGDYPQRWGEVVAGYRVPDGQTVLEASLQPPWAVYRRRWGGGEL